MRKRVTTLMALMALTGLGYAKTLYVSPLGDDAAKGTRKAPLASFEEARDRLRKVGGGKVFLGGGRHFRSQTFELDERDSHTLFASFKGEEAVLDGGAVIPPEKATPVRDQRLLDRLPPSSRDRVLQIDLKALGITDYGELGPRGFSRSYKEAPLELFIDGEACQVARWPNLGEKEIPLGKVLDPGSCPRNGDYSNRGAVFAAETPRIERWGEADDFYISGIFNYGFADDTVKVDSIDLEKGTIKTVQPHLYSLHQRGFTKWYALHLLEEIDAPGEYCVDKASGVLLFLPPGDISESLIQVSLMEEPMIAVEDAADVTFEGLTFENARGNGIYIEEGRDVTVKDCTFRSLGIVAVQMGQGASGLPDGWHNAHGEGVDDAKWVPTSRELGTLLNYIYANTAWDRRAGTGHSVEGCEIYNTGAGGVVLGGGDRKDLTPGNNRVENCHFHHVNRWDRMYRTPINVDGVGNAIRHNHIHDCPGQAVLLHGNDHLIEFNHFHHVVQDISDQAAIYMGRDPSESGNVIRHNFFHDIYNAHEGGHGVQAIFFDDCCTFGATVVGNVFYRTGNTGVIKFNGGGQSPILNNVFIDCPRPVQGGIDNTKRVRNFMTGELGRERLREAVDITKPPYSEKYPILLEVYEGTTPVITPFERNIVVQGDLSCFKDPASLDFTFKKDAEILKTVQGFEEIPFGKMGRD